MEKHPLPNASSQTPSQDPLDAAKANELDIDKVEPNMIVASTVDHSIVQSRVTQKSGRKLAITIVIILLLVVAAGGFAYYRFVVQH